MHMTPEQDTVDLGECYHEKATSNKGSSDVMVAVMGMTGTGKSTFIKLLTNDDRIRIGHDESETCDIQTAQYFDGTSGRTVTLIDTPGFDDSRDGVTDTNILEKIVAFLEPMKSEGKMKLNGIIYMHRISDPRLGAVSKRNLRMFQSLCGQDNLRNVRIVTTNWSRVSEQEGQRREKVLRDNAFKLLVDAGAEMCRHENNVQSARKIMSELVPLEAVTTQIQKELREGKTLAETSAGTVLAAEIAEMQKNHEKELAKLKKEMEEAVKAKDHTLRAELAEEFEAFQQKLARAEEDMKTLTTKRRGLIRDLAYDMVEVVGGAAKTGYDAYGIPGGVGGATAGVVAAPIVAVKRLLVGT